MSSKNNNKLNIPEARAAMDKFKMEAANEVGVNLKEGYNGHLTSREAGSVGGQMVKKVGTEARHDIEKLLGCKVFLELRVRVEPQWRRNANIIQRLGYGEQE